MDSVTLPQVSTDNLSSYERPGKSESIAGRGLKTLTIGVVTMLLMFQAAYFLVPGPAADVVIYATGRLLGPILVTLIIFGLFQIFKKFRSQRARWLIVFWVNALLLLGAINNTIQAILAVVK